MNREAVSANQIKTSHGFYHFQRWGASAPVFSSVSRSKTAHYSKALIKKYGFKVMIKMNNCDSRKISAPCESRHDGRHGARESRLMDPIKVPMKPSRSAGIDE